MCGEKPDCDVWLYRCKGSPRVCGEKEKMHWFRFRALFAALPEDTLMAKIMSWRTLDLADYDGSMREHYAALKERFALPASLRGGAAVAQTVAEHDAAFLARFRR